jgi:hypothetical protein
MGVKWKILRPQLLLKQSSDTGNIIISMRYEQREGFDGRKGHFQAKEKQNQCHARWQFLAGGSNEKSCCIM